MTLSDVVEPDQSGLEREVELEQVDRKWLHEAMGQEPHERDQRADGNRRVGRDGRDVADSSAFSVRLVFDAWDGQSTTRFFVDLLLQEHKLDVVLGLLN